MMFIIADKDPHKAVQYLLEHTNKRFYFKQLIELGQLICSAGFSNAYKKVYRGKEIQDWIKRHPWWTYLYYRNLLDKCKSIFRSNEAYSRARSIAIDLLLCVEPGQLDTPVNAIFRYKKDYQSEYTTNSELPINIACREYIKYIEEFKFKKER